MKVRSPGTLSLQETDCEEAVSSLGRMSLPKGQEKAPSAGRLGGRALGWSRAMTLVELMVALAVTALVVAAVGGVFSSQHRNYVRDRSEKEVIQDTVEVLRVLQRDLLQAGWAVAPKLAFLIRDGGSDGPDQIFVNDVDLIDPVINAGRIIEASECPGCLRVSSNSGSVVTLSDPWQPSADPQKVMDINEDNKTDFTVNGTYFFVISDATGLDNKTASVKNVDNNSLTLADSLAGTFVTPAIFYCVDTGSPECHPSGAQETLVLRRSDHRTGGALVPVADNVVDLQVVYQDDEGRWYGGAGCAGTGLAGGNFCERSPFEPNRIRLIRLSIVLRSPTKDKDLPAASSCRPAVENRSAGTAAECGYRYKVHTVLIHPRNTSRDDRT
ncbi:MAG: hypothetical protein ACUVWY_08580 [Desulfosoma sp.]|uniref:hypothetical protein n=1 Tax=Desulfosoma sp. TaxID=2603217 RepID=UPI00404A8802